MPAPRHTKKKHRTNKTKIIRRKKQWKRNTRVQALTPRNIDQLIWKCLTLAHNNDDDDNNNNNNKAKVCKHQRKVSIDLWIFGNSNLLLAVEVVVKFGTETRTLADGDEKEIISSNPRKILFFRRLCCEDYRIHFGMDSWGLYFNSIYYVSKGSFVELLTELRINSIIFVRM